MTYSFVLIQGWSERRHRVDGEVCGQKHSQAAQTEGHHVRSHQHPFHFFWTVSFSSRTFHVNPGADNSPLSLCLLWLWTVWISALRSSLQAACDGIFITKHNFRCALNGRLSALLGTLFEVVSWFFLFYFFPSCVSSSPSVHGASLTVITRAQKHQFSCKICKTVRGCLSVCSLYQINYTKLSSHF